MVEKCDIHVMYLCVFHGLFHSITFYEALLLNVCHVYVMCCICLHIDFTLGCTVYSIYACEFAGIPFSPLVCNPHVYMPQCNITPPGKVMMHEVKGEGSAYIANEKERPT